MFAPKFQSCSRGWLQAQSLQQRFGQGVKIIGDADLALPYTHAYIAGTRVVPERDEPDKRLVVIC